MANQYFKPFRNIEFQTFHKINDEFIEMNGIQIYYLPKTNVNLDFLYGEDPLQRFETKYELTMYLVNNQNWGGQGDLFAKFGMQFTDEITVSIQKDRFITQTGMEQPLIGDLLYLPWQRNKELFEITYVDRENPFYHLGEWSLFSIKGKSFVYSRESVPAIVAEEEDIHLDDILDDQDNMNDAYSMDAENTTEDILDTSESDPLE